MGNPLGSVQGAILDTIRTAVEKAHPGAQVSVNGGGGHFTIEVVWAAFEGKSTLEKQRGVLGSIAHLMKGDDAPVHAVDSVVTRAK